MILTDQNTAKELLDSDAAVDYSEDGAIKRRYDALSQDRQPYLDKAKYLAQGIIPFLYPQNQTGNTPFSSKAANQALAGRGTINLARTLTDTIYPSNARFFENRISPAFATELDRALAELKMVEEMEGLPEGALTEEAISSKAQIDNKLLERDEKIRQRMKATPDNENFFTGTLHSIAGGVYVFSKPNLDSSKIYTLFDAVIQFDSSGDETEVIVRDNIHISKFPSEILKDLFGTDKEEHFDERNIQDIEVYTRQVRRRDHWEIQVEVAGQRYTPMEGREELDSPPLMVIPFFSFPYHKYPISWWSINEGDLIQHENTALAINALNQAAAKVVGILGPKSGLSQKEISDAPGLSWIAGNPEGVQLLLADVSKNINALIPFLDRLERSLMTSFLLNEAVRRDAERLTATEIREVIKGLLKLLGGIYISFRRRFQRRYATRFIRLMEEAGEIEKIPAGDIELTMTTGVETLESEEELQALDSFMQRWAQLGEEAVAKLNHDEYGLRLANAVKLPTKDLILSEDQLLTKMGVREIVELSKQLGPNGPAMAAQAIQMIMETMNNGQSTPATAANPAGQPGGGGVPPEL